MKTLITLLAIVWFFLLFLLFYKEKSASGEGSFVRNYGGNNTDVGWSVIQTSDGGYAICGTSTSFSTRKYDAFLLKLNKLGDVQWSKRYGNSNSESALELIEKENGGYIITGISDRLDSEGNYDMLLLNTEEDGSLIWSETIGGDNEDYGTDMLELSDGSIMLTGYTYSYGQGADDLFIIKFNSNGDTLWTKTYGDTSHEHSYSIDYADDSGYVISGFTKSFTKDYYDAYVVKTDVDGDVEWSAVYGGDLDDRARTIRKVDDGYLIGGGCMSSGAGLMDLMLLKISFTGELLWGKTYGTPMDETANYMNLTDDGGCLIVGFSNTNEMDYGADLIAVRTDENGDTLWTGIWGEENIREVATNGVQSADGGYAILGASGKDLEVLLLKLGESGFRPEQRNNVPVEVNHADFHQIMVETIQGSGLDIKSYTNVGDFSPKMEIVQ